MRLLIAIATGWALLAQPVAPTQKELQGTIVKVVIGPGQQGPRLMVQPGTGPEWTVWLGSFRYLMDKDFNPKAGQRITVSGFPRDERELVAATVTLPDLGRTLRLRDEQGRPLWRGAGYLR